MKFATGSPATKPSGGCAAVNFEAVDAGVVLVSPVVVHLQLHVTEGILTGVLVDGQHWTHKNKNLKSPKEVLSPKELWK